jgi:hypothetical protein
MVGIISTSSQADMVTIYKCLKDRGILKRANLPKGSDAKPGT